MEIDWTNMDAPVSQYFKVYEVLNRDPRRVPTEKWVEDNILNLARNHLDRIREDLGIPLIITSWNRPEPINSQVGGVPNSEHTKGWAADLNSPSIDIYCLQKLIDLNWYGGMGYGANKGFIHLDIYNGQGWKTGGTKGKRWNY